MRPANHLVLFVKAPRLGRVMRRLAADIGLVAASAFYRHTVAAVTRRLGRDRRWRCWLAVTPDSAVGAPGLGSPWCSPIPQGAGDLGRRMARVLDALPPGPAVIIGTDIPDIGRGHIARAFRGLKAHDWVFGPAADGGYWLVGVRRRRRVGDLFAGVRWSTEFTLADTLANLAPGRSAALLDTLDDIDDGAAFARWRARKGFGAPRPTRAAP